MQRESMEFDVVIVGAGPAGLSTAIKLAQLAKARGTTLSICLLEKGSYVGAHILSGAVLETRALTELVPDWHALQAPVTVAVNKESFWYLTKKNAYPLPTPSIMRNHQNHIISLGELCQWLATYAEQLGVNIFPGFCGANLLYNSDKTKVLGIQTGDMGLDKQGKPTEQTQYGVNILAKQTVLAEGCRGSLSQQIMQHFHLRESKDPQSYALGVKELWKIAPDRHTPGKVIHTVGWPLDNKTYGGGFLYHFKDQLVSLGMVIGLDYKNPYLDPFLELQRFKLHPKIKPLLENAECLRYGARALNEGGSQAIPRLTFPGGLLVGCAAGMLNVGKIKGIHNALRSGMLAAESLFTHLEENEIKHYQQQFDQSLIAKELWHVRNLRPGFHKGLIPGLCYAALDQYLFRGNAPWTFHYKPDHLQLNTKKHAHKINYSKPDGKITFDKLTQVYLTATKHRENEKSHLKILNPETPVKINLTRYAGPETHYCPANVYEYIEENNTPKLRINFTNCIHCKTCDIKDPTQNIVWVCPEGGDGPNYTLM